MNHQGVAPRPVTSVPYLLLCILALSGAVSRPAHAGVREAWVRQHTGVKQANDAANAVAIDAAGNVIATGTADEDCFTTKYSRSGEMLWQRSYAGSNNLPDHCRALVLDVAGNVVVTGTVEKSRTGVGRDDSDFYTAKYAANDGSVLWEKLVNGPRDAAESPGQMDRATDVVLDTDGNALMVGTSAIRDIGHLATIKYGGDDGTILSGDYIALGCAYCGTFGIDAAIDGDNRLVVLANIRRFMDNARMDYGIFKGLTNNSTYQWYTRYNSPSNAINSSTSLAVTTEGDVVVAGYTRYSTAYPYTGVTALHVAKFAATNGALLWEKRYTNALALQIAVDAGGDVIVTGGSGDQGTNGFLTLKYSGVDGALLWETRYGNATNNPGAAQKLAVDSSGNVVVTGSSYNERGNTDIYTAKYNGADGGLMWEIRYNGAADGNDTVRGLALGPDGLVAVVGDSTGTNGVTSFTTILYQDDLPSLTIALVPEGVRLRSVGVDGSTYQIERAPSVTGPWEVIASPVATSSGLIEHIDTNRPPDTAFYRMRKP